MELNKEQVDAIEVIKKWASGEGPASISLTGFAGTGKSTLVVEAKKYIKNARYCALTGRSALRLAEAANVEASTLHSILYKRPDILKGGELEFKTLNSPSFKYLIIDEAGMITPKIFNDLKQWIHFYKIRILFVGDSFQLPPILTEAEKKKNPEFSVFSHVKGPELIKIMRNDDDIIDIATIVRLEKRIPTIGNKSYNLIQIENSLDYVTEQYINDPSSHMVLTWRNKIRMDINNNIRKKLGHISALPDEGEPIIFCRNGQGVLNGQISTIKKIVQGPIIEGVVTYRILLDDKKYVLCSVSGADEFMDGGSVFVKNWKAYLLEKKKYKLDEIIPISYGYVSTIHKIQGNEFRRVSIILDGSDINNVHFRASTILPNGDKVPFGIRFLYTGLTRAKEKATLVVGI